MPFFIVDLQSPELRFNSYQFKFLIISTTVTGVLTVFKAY